MGDLAPVAVFSRATIKLWPIAVLAVAAPAVPIGFTVASPSFTLAQPRPTSPDGDYPIRFELPPARPPALREAAPRLADGGPAVEFDLSDGSAAGVGGGSAIEIRKAVRLNGTDAGSATIRVSAGSTLSIAADELRALLAQAGRGDLAGQIGGRAGGPAGAGRFVDFEELRRQGIDVRYDVAADRVAISA